MHRLVRRGRVEGAGLTYTKVPPINEVRVVRVELRDGTVIPRRQEAARRRSQEMIEAVREGEGGGGVSSVRGTWS